MLKAYASYFVSYLLANLKGTENINKIILFGSVARAEADKNSDIDIFIEIKTENKKFKKEIEKTLEEFYKSREALIFKNKSIDNKINIIVGKLENWPDLKKSIDSTGISLYGKYIPSGIDGKKNAIILWDNIKKNRGAFLNKLYGFKVKEKRYKGIVESTGGIKLGKSSIMVPIEYREEILSIAKKYGANVKIIEVWT